MVARLLELRPETAEDCWPVCTELQAVRTISRYVERGVNLRRSVNIVELCLKWRFFPDHRCVGTCRRLAPSKLRTQKKPYQFSSDIPIGPYSYRASHSTFGGGSAVGRKRQLLQMSGFTPDA